MKTTKTIIEIIYLAILLAIKFTKELWEYLSVSVLKRYFHIETSAYKKWWSKRSKWHQRRLDCEHFFGY